MLPQFQTDTFAALVISSAYLLFCVVWDIPSCIAFCVATAPTTAQLVFQHTVHWCLQGQFEPSVPRLLYHYTRLSFVCIICPLLQFIISFLVQSRIPLSNLMELRLLPASTFAAANCMPNYRLYLQTYGVRSCNVSRTLPDASTSKHYRLNGIHPCNISRLATSALRLPLIAMMVLQSR